MTAGLLHALVFVAMGALAFASGCSRGSFAVIVPIVVPLAYSLVAGISLVTGALLSASALAFGRRACCCGESTVLATQGAGRNLISHGLTQLPYTSIAAGLAFVGFLLAA